jgi:hypothetical protein
MGGNYEGRRKNIIPAGQKVATTRSGFQSFECKGAAIFVLDVPAVTAGSITDLNIYIKAPSGRDAEIKVYAFTALAINAPGVYALPIFPNGGGAATWTKAPIQGCIPPEFDAEVVLAGGSNLKFQLDVMFPDT